MPPPPRAKRKTPAPAPRLYAGATTCDFRPEWDTDLTGDAVALLDGAHAADPDELTPQLILADLLCERGDTREAWVRAGCELWEACRTLKASGDAWDFSQANGALSGAAETATGWRLVGLWGALVAWHCPAGDGSGLMGRTWADERVKVVNRCCWWWAMGFLKKQPNAAWSQADAAWRQADAAGSQADAAGRQASAAGSQAYAAWRQASAAGRQASAASGRVWQFARAAWGLCEPYLVKLES